MISLIVARARNGAIGKDNDIPWHVPEDLAMFKRETLGGAIIMGRNTWDSLPFKPLKNRLNIVVSSQPDIAEHTVPSIDAALDLAHRHGYLRVYGIGGAGIYKGMLDKADRLLVTEVDIEVPDAEVYFPDFSDEDWYCRSQLPLDGTSPACRVDEYLRRKP